MPYSEWIKRNSKQEISYNKKETIEKRVVRDKPSRKEQQEVEWLELRQETENKTTTIKVNLPRNSTNAIFIRKIGFNTNCTYISRIKKSQNLWRDMKTIRETTIKNKEQICRALNKYAHLRSWNFISRNLPAHMLLQTTVQNIARKYSARLVTEPETKPKSNLVFHWFK